ncbi:hypothetical protein FG379_001913 [Cryptosporidium bovis]|uniref:uncharacterized protein n=1 Tax=Cryptosporidium bovis TaxID=310047 RepID=UPI00351AAB98|nr:hypothetical protein FG379_001913 [Cryptosporidium bovis]
MKTKLIRDCCDIGILKAAYNLEIGQTIFVRWTVVTESSDNTNDNCDSINYYFDGNDTEEQNNIEQTRKRIKLDEIEHETVWWPCKIRFPDKEERDSKGRRIYILEYDEKKGFESDKCRVVFENKKRVSHLDYNDLSSLFCREGELEDYLKEDKQEKENECEKKSLNVELEQDIEEDDEDKTISIQEIIDNGLFGLSGSDESDSGSGGDSNGIMNIFNSLPHEKKINLAQGYREFADKFISFLKDKMENDKDKNTITIDDIKDFIKSLGLDSENMGNN